MLPSSLSFIDVETTGLSSKSDRIIEIGIIRVEKGNIVKKFTTLINPQGIIPPLITTLTGITNQHVDNAPLFEDITHEVSSVLSGSVFVAHNVGFDFSFIQQEFNRVGIVFQANTLCTEKLSRQIFPQFSHHNLTAIIDRFHFTCVNRHRAYDDAFVLWEFYQYMQKVIPKKTFENLLATYLL